MWPALPLTGSLHSCRSQMSTLRMRRLFFNFIRINGINSFRLSCSPGSLWKPLFQSENHLLSAWQKNQFPDTGIQTLKFRVSIASCRPVFKAKLQRIVFLSFSYPESELRTTSVLFELEPTFSPTLSNDSNRLTSSWSHTLSLAVSKKFEGTERRSAKIGCYYVDIVDSNWHNENFIQKNRTSGRAFSRGVFDFKALA